MLSTLYLLPHTLPIIFLLDLYVFPMYDFKYLLPTFIVFVMLPIIDTFILGKNYINVEPLKEDEWYYDLILYSYMFLDLVCFILTLSFISNKDLTYLHILCITLSLSIVTGAVGITVGHELHHRRTINILNKNHKKLMFDQMLSEICLGLVSYNHFNILHDKIHHRYVATSRDPSYSPLNVNTNTHVISSFIKTFNRCLWIDPNGNSVNSWFKLNRQMLMYICSYIMVPILITCIFGIQSALVFIIQSVLSISYFERINMIQHFGLTRSIYERISEYHSWNSSHWITNYFIFQLPRHSEHHINSRIKYQYLKYPENSLELPYNYSIMLMLSYFSDSFNTLMKRELIKQTYQT